MENKKKKSTGLLLSILGVISLILITAGVTYAFFSYAKQGTTENTIRTGTITFVYNEKTSTGLTIENALPQSDATGMADNANGFEFTVTSKTPSTAYIDYIVTARMKADSTLPQDQVKLYLTSSVPSGATAEHNGTGYGSLTGDTAGSISTFAALGNVQSVSDVIDGTTIPAGTVEKVIYKGRIAAGQSSDYTRTFKLNMWLVGAEEKCFDGSNQVVAGVTDKATCEATSGNVWRADSSAVKDYSAYEFVKLSSIDATTATEYTVGDTAGTGVLVKGTDILTSVDYYTKLEAGQLVATDYTRLAAVNQSANKVYTVAQVTGGNTAPTSTGWEASEQFYPLNGQKFTVTINVYAEGYTTYTTPAQP